MIENKLKGVLLLFSGTVWNPLWNPKTKLVNRKTSEKLSNLKFFPILFKKFVKFQSWKKVYSQNQKFQIFFFSRKLKPELRALRVNPWEWS